LIDFLCLRPQFLTQRLTIPTSANPKASITIVVPPFWRRCRYCGTRQLEVKAGSVTFDIHHFPSAPKPTRGWVFSIWIASKNVNNFSDRSPPDLIP
jgi:hypothetical protein